MTVTFRDAKREVSFPVWSDAPLAAACRDEWKVGEFYKLRAAYRALRELRDELAPGTELSLAAALALPGVDTPSSGAEAGAVRAALEAAFSAAVVALDRMREEEGAALGRELARRLEAVRALCSAVRERGPEMVKAHQERLRSRVERLLGDSGVAVDPGRLEVELALLADKSDVTEELVRLESHAAQVDHLLASKHSVGRRLDFLLQEMGREVNTIGSKCQDSQVAHQVVELKSELERMREQVQNVE